MSAHLIFWPMLLVLAIPIYVLMLNGVRKAAERRSGSIPADAPINNTAWSLPVVLTSNALANQFQLPVIFYVLCLVLVQVNAVSQFVLIVSWSFATLRWVHVIVHVTTNNIPLRFGSFLLGALVLLTLLVSTIIALAKV